MLPVEFVVLGTPMSRYASKEAKRFWRRRVRSAAETAIASDQPPTLDAVVVRIAYFYMDDAPTADLDNIVKPILDVLTKLVYADDRQVIDLAASMRAKETALDPVPMSAILASGFASNSDFVWVVVDHASSIEVFRDLG